MFVKIIFQALLIIAAALFQFSFISGLPNPLNDFNLIIVVLIFILSLYGLKTALWWAAGVGFFLDIFSFSPFGVFLVCLILTVAAAYAFLINFFTNRSLYSFLALTALTTVFYALVLKLSNFTGMLFGPLNPHLNFDKYFLESLLKQIILNLLAALAVFYLINFLSNRFKPVFLERKKIK
jgi:rod shape-determining protein MreD